MKYATTLILLTCFTFSHFCQACKIDIQFHKINCPKETEFYYSDSHKNDDPKATSFKKVTESLSSKNSASFKLYSKDKVTSQFTQLAVLDLSKIKKLAFIIAIWDISNQTFSFKLVSGSLEEFPLGSRYLINTCSTPLKGVYSTISSRFEKIKQTKKKVFCEANGTTLVTALSPNAKKFDKHSIHMSFKKDDKWLNLQQSMWFHTPKKRHIIIYFTQEKANSIVATGITL